MAVSLSSQSGRAVAKQDPPPDQHDRPIGRIRLVVMTLATAYWFYAATTLALAVAVPIVTGWDATTIMSNSMAPTVSQGDVVAFEEHDGSLLGVGTIVKFEDPVREGATLTHRIVAVDPEGVYETKGDANSGPDSTLIRADSVIGVARMVIPYAGLPHFWMETDQHVWLVGWILITAAAATVMTPHRHRRERLSGSVPAEVTPGSSQATRFTACFLADPLGVRPTVSAGHGQRNDLLPLTYTESRS